MLPQEESYVRFRTDVCLDMFNMYEKPVPKADVL